MISRRNLLLGSSLATGAVLAARPAGALTMQEVPTKSGLGLALSNRCGDSSEHAQILVGLQSQLAARGARSGETATAYCPICGCPVVATAR